MEGSVVEEMEGWVVEEMEGWEVEEMEGWEVEEGRWVGGGDWPPARLVSLGPFFNFLVDFPLNGINNLI